MRTHTGPIKVLIAEDHDIFEKGIRSILEQAPDIQVLPQVLKSGTFFLENVSNLRPDCLLLDMRMPDFMPIPAIRQVKKSIPAPKILILSSVKSSHWVQDACAAGADGYLTKKEASGLNLIDAIRNVMNGAMAYYGEAQELLIEERTTPPEITDLQYTVLKLLNEGKSTPEMVTILNSKPNAIHQTLRRLRLELGVATTSALIPEAQRRGILPPDDEI